MKSRRGSTTSPMSVENTSSASSVWLDPDLEEGARLGIEGGLPELLRVHLAEALVALDGDALAAELHHRIHQPDGPRDEDLALLRVSLPRLT